MEKLIGGIIRFNREQLGYSIKKVSQEVGVSDGYISRIERNNENPTEEMKKKIFESLNVTYCEENIEDQFENDFRIFYDDVVYTRDFQKSYDVILAYSHIIKSTSSYIKYLVADMVYKGMINQKVNPKDYQFIAGYFDYLEDYQKQIYYDYMGIFSKSMEKTIDALNYYSLAFQYKGIDESKAMVNYHMSMDLKRAGEIQKAIEVAIISRDIFARIVNLKRLTAVSGLLASLYSISGDYEKAELIFMNCIYAFQLIQMEGQLKVLYNNMAWHFIRSERYQKLIDLETELLRETEYDYHIYFYLSYAYYKLNNKKKAIENIEIAKKEKAISDVYMEKVIQAFSVYLSHSNIERKEKHLLNAYKQAVKTMDMDLVIFTQKLLKDFYKETQQKEKYYITVENLMNYYKKKSL